MKILTKLLRKNIKIILYYNPYYAANNNIIIYRKSGLKKTYTYPLFELHDKMNYTFSDNNYAVSF